MISEELFYTSEAQAMALHVVIAILVIVNIVCAWDYFKNKK